MGLPQHIDRVSLLRNPEEAEDPLFAIVSPNLREGSFDAEVVDERGNLYLQLSGYRTVVVPGAVDAGPLKVLQAAMSLEEVTV